MERSNSHMRNEIKNTMLFLSALYVILGITMIAWPDAACRIACYILGATLFVYGAVQSFRYFHTNGKELLGGSLFIGMFLILTGILIVIRAEVVVSVLIAVMGMFVIVDSVIKFIFARELRALAAPGWKIQMISVIVLFVLGVFMLIYNDPKK